MSERQTIKLKKVSLSIICNSDTIANSENNAIYDSPLPLYRVTVTKTKPDNDYMQYNNMIMNTQDIIIQTNERLKADADKKELFRMITKQRAKKVSIQKNKSKETHTSISTDGYKHAHITSIVSSRSNNSSNNKLNKKSVRTASSTSSGKSKASKAKAKAASTTAFENAIKSASNNLSLLANKLM